MAFPAYLPLAVATGSTAPFDLFARFLFWSAAFGLIRRVGPHRAMHSLLPVELDDGGRVAACWVNGGLLTAHAEGYEQRLHARWPGFGFLPG